MDATATAAPATTTQSAPPAAATAAVPHSGQSSTEKVAATKEAEAKQATAPEYHELSFKDGKTKKLTIAELKAAALLGEGAYGKMEEAAKIRKQADAEREAFKKKKIQSLIDAGMSKEEVRAEFEGWYKENFIDPESMTPEQKELAELRKFKTEREETAKQQKEREQAEAQSAEEKEFFQGFQQEIVQALDASDLPKSKFTVGRMAYWIKQNLRKGYDAPMEVIVNQVKQERNAIVSSMVKDSAPAQLVEMLGKDVVQKIRMWDLENLEKLQGGGGTPPAPRDNDPSRPKKSMSDVDRYFREMRQKKR